MSDINVTPLIDVVLVLLVVFMVITPMLQSGMPVDLPSTTASVTENDVGQYIVISVTKDKGMWIETTQVTSDNLLDVVNEKLPAMIEQRTKSETQPECAGMILVKADLAVTYEQVREPLDILADANISNVCVATQKDR